MNIPSDDEGKICELHKEAKLKGWKLDHFLELNLNYLEEINFHLSRIQFFNIKSDANKKKKTTS